MSDPGPRKSDPGGLAGFAEALEFFAAATLAGLFVIGLAAHFFAEAAALTQFAEPTDGVLNRLTGTNPELHHKRDSRIWNDLFILSISETDHVGHDRHTQTSSETKFDATM